MYGLASLFILPCNHIAGIFAAMVSSYMTKLCCKPLNVRGNMYSHRTDCPWKSVFYLRGTNGLPRFFRTICSGTAAILIALLFGTVLSAQGIPSVEPMELRRGMPVVQVTVNGKGPFTFGVDTGAGGEAGVSRSFAQKLGLPISGEAEVGDPSGRNPQKVPVFLITSLTVAGVAFKDIKATQLPPMPDQDFDGILGFVLFHDYLLSLDYPHQEMLLSVGNLSPDSGKTIIPFTMSHDIPVITLKVGAGQVDADVDSGRMGGLSLPEAFAKDLRFASQPVTIGRGRTVSGEVEIKGAQLAGDIQVAGYTFSRPFVEIDSVFPTANFGAIPLRHFAITFDQKNKLVRLVSNEQTLTIDPPRMMGGPPPQQGSPPAPDVKQ